VAESLIRGAVEVGEGLLPFFSNLLEDIWGNGQLGGSSIDDGWIRGVLTWLLHWLGSVVHALTLKGPGSEPVLEVLKGLKTLSSSNDLGGVVSSEESVWGFTHFLGGDRETNHSSINNTIILKGPQIVQLLLFHVLMGRKSENTIRVVAQSLGFVESQELEESTFVIFELKFGLDGISSLTLQWLDASIILPNETL